MKKYKPKLTMGEPVIYQIKVPGLLDAMWADEDSTLDIFVEENVEGQPISILTGTFDQAALQGLLRRLYSIGLPLILVVRIDGL